MSEHADREWHFFIRDMQRFAENILAYTEGLTFEEFINSGLNYDAMRLNLEHIW